VCGAQCRYNRVEISNLVVASSPATCIMILYSTVQYSTVQYSTRNCKQIYVQPTVNNTRGFQVN